MSNPTNTSTEPKRETYSIVGSDGSLETYVDQYQVTEEEVETAAKLEQYILDIQDSIEESFLKIGAALVMFEDQRLYLARGLPTMRAWLSGTEFHFSYEHGTRLMRIVRDLIPVIGEEKAKQLPISTMKELLPMLHDGSTPEQILDAVEEVEGLTTRDAKLRLREIRGIENELPTTIFRASVKTREGYNLVTITCYSESGEVYNATPQGPMKVRHSDWPKLEARFGFAVEYEDE